MKAACSSCGAILNLPDHAAGKNARCPNCGTVFAVDAEPMPLPPKLAPTPRPLPKPPATVPDEREEDDEDFVRRRRRRNQGVPPWVWLAAGLFGVAVLVVVIIVRWPS